MRQTQSGITVIGSSTVSTAADRVRLRIAVEQFAAGAAEALTRSSENARTLRAGLRGAGIAERSIQTTGLSVDVQWGERQKVRSLAPQRTTTPSSKHGPSLRGPDEAWVRRVR